MMNGNGMPLQVPDLGQLGQTQTNDPAVWAQRLVLQSAGLTAGGVALVDTVDGGPHEVQSVDVAVAAGPAGLQVLFVTGTIGSVRTVIPWHAVTRLRPGCSTLATG